VWDAVRHCGDTIAVDHQALGMQGNMGRPTGKILTAARDLQRRKARERQSRFVAEGVRVVEELVRSGWPLDGALVTSSLTDSPRGAALRRELESLTDVAQVSDVEFSSAAGTDQPQGVLAIGQSPETDLATALRSGHGTVLVLDAVQDPGNVGTLIRTAAAMGASAVVALPGTVDVWNAKVIRAAAGGHFRLAVLHADGAELKGALADAGLPLWASDAEGVPLDQQLAGGIPPRVAVAVSNEGAGLSAAVRDAASAVVALRMSPGAESLNVGVAAGIILYALRS
jgi:TrmH family RNA methyltransferase